MSRFMALLLAVTLLLSAAGCKESSIPDDKGSTGKVVSRIAGEGNNLYVEYKGEPYLFYALQMRLDWVFEDKGGDVGFIDENFSKAVEMGFKSVAIPIYWSHIESTMNSYSFERLELYYGFLKKYDLSVQWLWFGTNVCGSGVCAPGYVKSDTDTYKRVYTELAPDGVWWDFSCKATMEREQLALKKMMEWIAEHDTDQRCVMIQINNEVDQGAGYFQPNVTDQNIGNWYDTKEAHDKYCWVGGQREEVFAQLSALGDIVHNSNYSVVTRVNVSGAGRAEVPELVADFKDLLATSGVDIVGVDCYAQDWSVLSSYINVVDGNVTHVAENGGSYDSSYNTVKLFDMGAGMVIYCHRDDRENFGMYDNSEGRSGRYWIELPSTPKLRAFNLMINKALKPLTSAVCKRQFMEFNGERFSSDVNITKSFGDTKITFTCPTGGLGIAFPISEKEYVIMATHDDSKFTFGDTVTVSAATFGKFDDLTWKPQNTAKTDGNTIVLRAHQVVKVDLL